MKSLKEGHEIQKKQISVCSEQNFKLSKELVQAKEELYAKIEENRVFNAKERSSFGQKINEFQSMMKDHKVEIKNSTFLVEKL